MMLAKLEYLTYLFLKLLKHDAVEWEKMKEHSTIGETVSCLRLKSKACLLLVG